MATKKEVAKTVSHLPADLDLQERIKRDLQAASEQVEAAAVERIRMGAKGFTTPDGDTGDVIQGVVVDFISSNMHYPNQFDKNDPSPPNCFAMGRIISQLVPDQKSTEPQADACKDCEKNKFESGTGKAKACKNTRQLALIKEGATEEDEASIWLLTIPPASIRYWDTYVSTTLKGRYSLPPGAVVTQIFMDPNKDFAAPRFKFVRALNDEELAYYYSRKEEAEATLFMRPVTTAS